MMHPEIEKFWKNQNYLSKMGDRSSEYYAWYVRVEKDPFGYIIAHEWKDHSHTEYFFGDKKYSEERMLKIVRLKAFL